MVKYERGETQVQYALAKMHERLGISNLAGGREEESCLQYSHLMQALSLIKYFIMEIVFEI